jgi:hypothetical protein
MKKIIFLLLVVFAASVIGCKPATPPAADQAAPAAEQAAPAAEQAPAK